MDADRLHELFAAACDLEPAARDSFLAASCAGQPELRAELESLLGEDQVAGAGSALLASGAWLRAEAVGGADRLAAGQRVGRYVIVREIGMGGMGRVYEAEQQEPRRRVALKVIAVGGRIGAQAFVDRFRHEAAILGRLHHPGIAQIYEAGTHEASGSVVPFIALELVEGESLTQYTKRRRLDLRARIELVARVCDAVAHAHQRGVVHRDLKPANILVDAAGQPKVLDFGVARLLELDGELQTLHTRTGQIIGTLQYMSPEQVSGDPAAVGRPSDVYALGVILYELLTGQPPYDLARRSLPEAARLIQEREPSRIGSSDRRLRGDLETIVARALEKEPARRYASAADLAADLRRFLRDEPIVARPPSTFEQVARFARRNKGLTAGGVIAFAALASGFGISLAKTREALAARAEATREASRSALSAAASAQAAQQPAMARTLLESVPAADRRWEWSYLSSSLDQSVAAIPAGPDLVAAIIEPDGKSVWIARASGAVERWRDPFAEPEVVAALPKPVHTAVFARDVSRIAAIAGDAAALAVFDPATGLPRATCAQSAGPTAQLFANRDATRIAWIRRPSEPSTDGSRAQVWEWDVASGQVRVVFARERDGLPAGSILALEGDMLAAAMAYGSPLLVRGAARDTAPVILAKGAPSLTSAGLSPDGAWLAAGATSKRILLYDTASGGLSGALSGHTGTVGAIAFGEDKNTLWSGSADQTIREWDLRAGLVRRAFTGHRAAVDAVVPAAGGRVLSHGQDGTLRVFAPADDSTVLKGHGGAEPYVYAIAFKPGDQILASGSWDSTVRLWHAPSGAPITAGAPFEPTLPKVHDLAYSPDGAWLALAGAVRKLHLIDTATGQVSREIPTPQVVGRSIAWTADGSLLLVASGVAQGVRKQPASIRPAYAIDFASGRVVAELSDPACSIACVASSPDGRFIATGGHDGTVGLWGGSSLERERTLRGHSAPIMALAFSRDSRHLASASADGTARVFDLGSGDVQVLREHTATVYAVAFSADGERVATGCLDSVVRLFDCTAGRLVLELRGHDDYVHDVAFSQDGSVLASSSGDGTVRLWDSRPLSERYRARRRFAGH